MGLNWLNPQKKSPEKQTNPSNLHPFLSTNCTLDDETYLQNMLEVIHSVILDS